MSTQPSCSRLIPGIFLVLGFLAPGMGALAPTTVSAAGPSVTKPVPGPMAPIPASRPLVHGGSLHGATTPGRSGGPKVLIHPTTAQLLGHGQKPARPALGGPGLPAHGRLIHPQAASTVGNRGYWNGSHYVAPTSGPVEHPLLPPPPSHSHGTTTRPRYPSTFDASTQVDNNPNASFCGFGANESSVAQSTDNPNNVVDAAQMYMNGDGSCGDSHPFAFYSHDGGQHWQQVIMPGLSLQAGGDTSVAYDPLHHVFVLAFIQFDRTDNSGQINVEVSSDGSSWGLLTSLDTTDGSVYTNDKAMITVDQNPSSPHYGRVAVSWTEFPNAGGMFLYDAVSDDGGNSWTGSTTSINYSNSNCGNGSSPAFDANGDLMVAWDSCAGAPTPLSGSGYTLEEELSSDGGINWTASSDTVITGITDIGYKHNCLLGSTSFRCNSFPSLAGDPNPSDEGGTAFVIVWANEDPGITDSRFPNQSATISEIHGLISLNGGSSWSGPTGFGFAFISFANFGDKFFPWIAFAPDGRMNVGYSDREDDASSGNPSGTSYDEYGTEAGSLASFVSDAYVAYTDDGTLGNPGSSTFIGDYAGITSQDNNFDTFPTWTDNRSGVNNDVRTMDLCYIDCYTFLAPYSPISAGSSSFTDLYQFN
ncbi:MAG: selenium-binding family protein, partial [Chloroflexota bacterium]|nr:selenium-binding family protein [Chloroflexota bacterium]